MTSRLERTQVVPLVVSLVIFDIGNRRMIIIVRIYSC